MTLASCCNRLLQWRADTDFNPMRGGDIYIDPYSLLKDNSDLTLSRRTYSTISVFKKSKLLVSHNTLSLLSNMHAFTKLIPLALATIAIALPGQLQERESTTYDDSVKAYVWSDRPTLS